MSSNNIDTVPLRKITINFDRRASRHANVYTAHVIFDTSTNAYGGDLIASTHRPITTSSVWPGSIYDITIVIK